MDRENIRIMKIYIILFTLFLVGSLVIAVFIIPNYFREYARMLVLLVWIGLFVITKPMENEKRIDKGKKGKVKITLVIVVSLYILYFISGIVIGYNKNPYSRNIISMLLNIVYVIGLVLTKQYVRDKITNAKKQKSIYIIITLLFAVTELSIKDALSASVSEQSLFEYISGNVIPQIIISAVCTYLVINSGFEVVYAYLLPIEIAKIILPIIPEYDWFVIAGLRIVLAIIVLYFNNYEDAVNARKLNRKQIRRENPIRKIPIFVIFVFFIIFIAGVLPYKPVAVISNSMIPSFKRGSIVITKKVDENYKELKIGDILEYGSSRGTIIHRITKTELQTNGDYVFTTKGDNNNSEDDQLVYQNQVKGVVKITFPYLGYPAVLFYENVLKNI